MEILLTESREGPQRGVFFMGKQKRKQKKHRKWLYGAAITLCLAGVYKGIMSRVFFAAASMEGAFSVLLPEERKGTVTMTARYPTPEYGCDAEKLLNRFAEEIDLVVEEAVREVIYEGRTEYIYERKAAGADSLLKVVYLEKKEEYYVCAEVTLFDTKPQDVTAFQRRMEKAAKGLGLTNISTTLELCGTYSGEIPLGKKDALTDELLKELYATPVYENRENDYYTVYAYTGAIEEYIVVEKKRLNVQVAIYYDRSLDRTEVVLASPIGLR